MWQASKTARKQRWPPPGGHCKERPVLPRGPGSDVQEVICFPGTGSRSPRERGGLQTSERCQMARLGRPNSITSVRSGAATRRRDVHQLLLLPAAREAAGARTKPDRAARAASGGSSKRSGDKCTRHARALIIRARRRSKASASVHRLRTRDRGRTADEMTRHGGRRPTGRRPPCCSHRDRRHPSLPGGGRCSRQLVGGRSSGCAARASSACSSKHPLSGCARSRAHPDPPKGRGWGPRPVHCPLCTLAVCPRVRGHTRRLVASDGPRRRGPVASPPAWLGPW